MECTYRGAYLQEVCGPKAYKFTENSLKMNFFTSTFAENL